MLLHDRMILITECELKESGSNKIVEEAPGGVI